MPIPFPGKHLSSRILIAIEWAENEKALKSCDLKAFGVKWGNPSRDGGIRT
jgi:hypothetical protein